MARWQDRFFVGQSVEIMIEGNWVRGTITRKTLRGTPIVRTDEGTFAADRKAEVRPEKDVRSHD